MILLDGFSSIKANKKSHRSLNGDDMLESLKVLQSRADEVFVYNTQINGA